MISLLVDRGAKLEEVDQEFGTTALGWAIRYGRIKLARYFIEAGASRDPNGVSEDVSPRSLAEFYGDQDVVNLLVS